MYKNLFLSGLPPRDLALLKPSLQFVELPQGEVLGEPGQRVSEVVFLEGGMVSLLTQMQDGSAIEIATLGRESIVGVSVGARQSSQQRAGHRADRGLRLEDARQRFPDRGRQEPHAAQPGPAEQRAGHGPDAADLGMQCVAYGGAQAVPLDPPGARPHRRRRHRAHPGFPGADAGGAAADRDADRPEPAASRPDPLPARPHHHHRSRGIGKARLRVRRRDSQQDPADSRELG